MNPIFLALRRNLNFAQRIISIKRATGPPRSIIRSKFMKKLVATTATSSLAIIFALPLVLDWYKHLSSSLLQFSLECSNESPDISVLQDPVTGITLPREISLRVDDQFPLRILGFGVRAVTFLRISVYVVGIYVNREEKDFIVDKSQSLEDFVASMERAAIYIAPVRSTGLTHLRDGLVRILTKAIPQKIKELKDPILGECIGADIVAFKALFPNTIVKRGQVLLLERTETKGLNFFIDGVLVGSIRCPWITDALFEAYLREKKPISTAAQRSCTKSAFPARSSPLNLISSN